MKPHDLHNRIVKRLLKMIVKPIIANGGNGAECMVVVESLAVGVLMAAGKPEGDGPTIDMLAANAKQRLRELRAVFAKRAN